MGFGWRPAGPLQSPGRRQCRVPSGPADEYRARLSRLDSARQTLDRLDRRFSYARLLTIRGRSGAAAIAWWRARPRSGLARRADALFLVLVQRHDRILHTLAAVSAVDRLLRSGTRTNRGPVGWQRRTRRPLPGRTASVRQRSRSLRQGLAVRAAVHRADTCRRRDPRRLAEASCSADRDSRKAGGGHGTDARTRPSRGAIAGRRRGPGGRRYRRTRKVGRRGHTPAAPVAARDCGGADRDGGRQPGVCRGHRHLGALHPGRRRRGHLFRSAACPCPAGPACAQRDQLATSTSLRTLHFVSSALPSPRLG